MQLLLLASSVLVVAPFVPWGRYLSSSLVSNGPAQRQAVVIDANPAYGAAAGAAVNVNDLTTFPPNNHWVVTYPTSGNSTQDYENPDTFVKFELIRLPSNFGGGSTDASAFVAFSKVCVHLGCSPNYGGSFAQDPVPSRENYECPCHGSIYEIPDGKAVQGPASLQPPPTNAIPMLTLTADPDGSLYIEIPVWDVDHNGVVSYGRAETGSSNPSKGYSSYYEYILPVAEGKIAPPGGSSSSSTSTASESSTGSG